MNDMASSLEKFLDTGIKVEAQDPVKVMTAQAKKDVWGYFMFPSVWKLRDGRLVCAVTIGEDEMPSETDYHYLWYISENEGDDWIHIVPDINEAESWLKERTTLKSGRQIYYRPKIVRVDNIGLKPFKSKNIEFYGHCKGIHVLFRLGDLPKEYRTINFFAREANEKKWKQFESEMDPDILVPAFKETVSENEENNIPLTTVCTRLRELMDSEGDNRLPVCKSLSHYGSQWATERDLSGNNLASDEVVRLCIPTPTGSRLHNHSLEPIMEMMDGSLAVAVKTGRLPWIGKNELFLSKHPDIYQSFDGGLSWKYSGNIPVSSFKNHQIARAHLTIDMPKGNWVAHIRTSSPSGTANSPLILTRSYDSGKIWTEPEYLRPSSTNPVGGILPNGIAFRMYGRPGQFITFCADGEGKQWGNDLTIVPIPFENIYKENSCCNSCTYVTGFNEFIVVYTDYGYKDKAGRSIKTVLSRKIRVTHNS